jgi:1-deoxy-D-xylulose-5-phosphate reductoisomerase
LGATGSIGSTTVRVACHHRIPIVALAARRGSEALAQLACRLRPHLVAVADAGEADRLSGFGLPRGTKVLAGEEGFVAAATAEGADTTVVAVPGLAGLAPTLAALAAGRRVLTANKETLVAAGPLLKEWVRRGLLVSVDSEHSALAQLLEGRRDGVAELILTASGGPFVERSEAELQSVTAAQAVDHPTWRMGPKVSVDSATLMNKGLEVIEAHVLFDVPYDCISVVWHRQSVVHALVRFQDEAVLAQCSAPDMAIPIQWALLGGQRRSGTAPRLDLFGLDLTFRPLPPGKDLALRLAYEAGRIGGTRPAELSAANEVAVAAFLKGEIGFVDILPLVAETLARLPANPSPVSVDDVVAADRRARALARSLVEQGGHPC